MWGEEEEDYSSQAKPLSKVHSNETVSSVQLSLGQQCTTRRQNEFFGGKWPEIGSRAITLRPLVRPPHPVNWVHINIGATGALIIIRAPHFSPANINLIHNDIYSISRRFYPWSLSCLLIGNKNKFYNKMSALDEY